MNDQKPSNKPYQRDPDLPTCPEPFLPSIDTLSAHFERIIIDMINDVFQDRYMQNRDAFLVALIGAIHVLEVQNRALLRLEHSEIATRFNRDLLEFLRLTLATRKEEYWELIDKEAGQEWEWLPQFFGEDFIFPLLLKSQNPTPALFALVQLYNVHSKFAHQLDSKLDRGHFDPYYDDLDHAASKKEVSSQGAQAVESVWDQLVPIRQPFEADEPTAWMPPFTLGAQQA